MWNKLSVSLVMSLLLALGGAGTWLASHVGTPTPPPPHMVTVVGHRLESYFPPYDEIETEQQAFSATLRFAGVKNARLAIFATPHHAVWCAVVRTKAACGNRTTAVGVPLDANIRIANGKMAANGTTLARCVECRNVKVLSLSTNTLDRIVRLSQQDHIVFEHKNVADHQINAISITIPKIKEYKNDVCESNNRNWCGFGGGVEFWGPRWIGMSYQLRIPRSDTSTPIKYVCPWGGIETGQPANIKGDVELLQTVTCFGGDQPDVGAGYEYAPVDLEQFLGQFPCYTWDGRVWIKGGIEGGTLSCPSRDTTYMFSHRETFQPGPRVVMVQVEEPPGNVSNAGKQVPLVWSHITATLPDGKTIDLRKAIKQRHTEEALLRCQQTQVSACSGPVMFARANIPQLAG